MKRLGLLAVLLLVCGLTMAHAQSSERACASTRVNAKGTAGASLTVDATTAGIVVADANTSRCGLLIRNETANTMRCAPSTGKYALVVSSTVGFLWPASPEPLLGWPAQDEWRCIRTGGTSATISVMEFLP